jgi:O-antigen ligase
MEFLCYLLIFASLAHPGALYPPFEKYRVFFILCLILGLVYALNVIQGRRDFVKLPQNKFIIGLLLVYTFSELQYLYLTGTFNTFIFWLKKVIIFFLIANLIDTPAKLKKAAWWTFLSVFVLSLFAWYFYIEDPELVRFKGRLGSIGDYNFSNSYAMLLTVSWPLFFALFEVERSVLRKLFILAVLLSFIAASTLTYSRGGTLGLMIAISLSMLLSRKTLKNMALKGIAIAGILLFFLGYVAKVVVSQRTNVAGYFGGDASSGDRLMAWVAAIGMFFDNPLLGVGYGHFIDEAKKYGMDKSMLAHNTFLSVLAETGLLGILFFTLVIIVTIKVTFKASKYFQEHEQEDLTAGILSQGILISMIAFLVNTSFSVKDHDPIFWLIVSLGAACGTIMTRQKALESMAKRREITVMEGIGMHRKGPAEKQWRPNSL